VLDLRPSSGFANLNAALSDAFFVGMGFRFESELFFGEKPDSL
jgi:hypothetical protein